MSSMTTGAVSFRCIWDCSALHNETNSSESFVTAGKLFAVNSFHKNEPTATGTATKATCKNIARYLSASGDKDMLSFETS